MGDLAAQLLDALSRLSSLFDKAANLPGRAGHGGLFHSRDDGKDVRPVGAPDCARAREGAADHQLKASDKHGC